MPKVSIIVPIYNNGRFLDRCISSLKSQTLEDIEIILVNDGSTDNSEEVAIKHSKLDKRIKVISLKSNGGTANARNLGIESATGDFVGFVDSDDWVEKIMFEKMHLLATTNNHDIVVCDIKLVNEDMSITNVDTRIGSLPTLELTSQNRSNLLKNYYSTVDLMISASTCIKMFNRAFLQSNNLKFSCLKQVVSEDFYFSARAFAFAKSIGFVEAKLYNYFQHSESYVHNSHPRFEERKIFMLGELFKLYFSLGIINVFDAFLDIYSVDKNVMKAYFFEEASKIKSNDLKIMKQQMKPIVEFYSYSVRKNSIFRKKTKTLVERLKIQVIHMLLRCRMTSVLSLYYTKKNA